MPPNHAATVSRGLGWKGFLAVFLLLAIVLGLLFRKSFVPEMTVFSNDGPLGLISADQGSLPEGFKGAWMDLNWLGGRWIPSSPNISNFLAVLLGPVLFSKTYPILALLTLGLTTWFFFRQLGFSQMTSMLGALASSLNTGAFAIACWGLPMWTFSRAMTFLALGLLVMGTRRHRWICAALAGLAVGMGVAEGFDVGALFSLLVAAFAVFQALQRDEPAPKRAAWAGLRVLVIAGFAAYLAAQSLQGLVGTHIQGIAGTQQDERTREEQWDWATQWSLPKIETVRVFVAGLFGYRMDTPGGGEYWGTVGRQPGWETHHQGLPRHSGSGEYAGILVVLVAAWGLGQAFRGEKSCFDPTQKKYIYFFAGAALVALFLAFGRHAPFYKALYQLPYFSTIRNPVKFMHLFQVALLALFGFGLHGLSRLYLENASQKVRQINEQVKTWWSLASIFERRWTFGLVGLVGISLLGWLIFSSSRTELERYLAANAFAPAQAAQIAIFSLKEVGWHILFLILSVGVLLLIFCGWFSGGRAKFAGMALGVVLVADLARANQPWILHYNYQEKYATNPINEILRNKPYEHRVTVLPFQLPQVPQLATMQQIYHVYWMQHTFPFHNVHSLDVIQEPRVPEEKVAVQRTLGPVPNRYWQLTNTRFIFGVAGLEEALNQQLDPEKRRFRMHTAFNVGQERADGPLIVQTNSTGPFALIEFTGALPRAQLYSNWQVVTNLETMLKMLPSPEFHPEQTVLVPESMPTEPLPAGTNATPGRVEITEYAPKHLKLKSAAEVPTVLLLNDRYDPGWEVTVDGQPAKLFRANFIMRGIYLPPGSHSIEMKFVQPMTAFYISLSALGVGVVLLVLLVGFGRAEKPPLR